MSILLAVNDGIAKNNWNEADICFLVAGILGALAAIAYAAGVGTITKPEEGPDKPTDATTTTPVGPASTTKTTARTTAYGTTRAGWTLNTWHYRAHEIAAALLSLAVAAVAFGLFLQ
jgi:hypothetical protein